MYYLEIFDRKSMPTLGQPSIISFLIKLAFSYTFILCNDLDYSFGVRLVCRIDLHIGPLLVTCE